MQKLIFGAVLALCLAIPGMASANVCPMAYEMEAAAPEGRLQEILNAAANELGMSHDCMAHCYDAGDVTVEQEGDFYRVTVVDADGGLGEVVILDTF